MIYSIAGLTVELKFKYEYGRKKCARYLSEGTPILSAEATDEEIQKEALLIPENPLGVAEFDCVFRKLYTAFPEFGRITFHGAAISIDEKAYLFAAPSGTGKSTHIKLWRKRFGQKVKMIDGDKPFISFENGEAYVWGSPRSGKEGWNNPTCAKLCGIAFLQRSEKNEIFSVTPAQIIEEAFIQFYIPKTKKGADMTISFLQQLLSAVPLYKLLCNMDIEAAEVAYKGMKNS